MPRSSVTILCTGGGRWGVGVGVGGAVVCGIELSSCQ